MFSKSPNRFLIQKKVIRQAAPKRVISPKPESAYDVKSLEASQAILFEDYHSAARIYSELIVILGKGFESYLYFQLLSPKDSKLFSNRAFCFKKVGKYE